MDQLNQINSKVFDAHLISIFLPLVPCVFCVRFLISVHIPKGYSCYFVYVYYVAFACVVLNLPIAHILLLPPFRGFCAFFLVSGNTSISI